MDCLSLQSSVKESETHIFFLVSYVTGTCQLIFSSFRETKQACGSCSQPLSVWALPWSSRSPTFRFHLKARSS